jgi:hypothetical protein
VGEYIDIAVIFACESDGLAVRRKHGFGLHAGARREPVGNPAPARHAPQVASVGEDNRRFVHSRPLEQVQGGAGA